MSDKGGLGAVWGKQGGRVWGRYGPRTLPVTFLQRPILSDAFALRSHGPIFSSSQFIGRSGCGPDWLAKRVKSIHETLVAALTGVRRYIQR